MKSFLPHFQNRRCRDRHEITTFENQKSVEMERKRNFKIDEFHRKSHFWAEKEISGPEKKLIFHRFRSSKIIKNSSFWPKNSQKRPILAHFWAISAQFDRNRSKSTETDRNLHEPRACSSSYLALASSRS